MGLFREGCVNPHETPELGDRIDELWHDLAMWSQKTFGGDDVRGPIGPLRHLAKEVKEAEDVAVEDRSSDDLATELADCLLLVFDASRRGGVSLMDLLRATQSKLKVCKTRTYPKPVGDEVSEHVRGEAMGYLTDETVVERLLALGRGESDVTEAERRELAGYMITFAGELFAATGQPFLLNVGPKGVAIGFPATTDATVSGETMEDVLRELEFTPGVNVWGVTIGIRRMFVEKVGNDTWVAEFGSRYGHVTSPAHLRRIVAAEVACAAAWRGEEAGTETKETDR